MGLLSESFNYIHKNDMDIFEINPDYCDLNIHENIAELGQVLYFINNNLQECISLYGPSVVTFLIDDAKKDFQDLLESIIPVPDDKIFETSKKPVIPVPSFSKLTNTANTANTTNINNSSVIPVPKDKVPPDMIDIIKSHSHEIGWTVLAGLALAAAYKIYKNYFSKAAKYCKGKTGAEKDACMTNYKNQAFKLKIKSLKKSLSLANKTKDSVKFRQKIQKEINKIQKKIKK